MLNVKYGYAYGRSLLSVLCVHFVRFLHVSRKLTDTDQTEQYHRKLWGQCCCHYPIRNSSDTRRRHTMAELFEERLCEAVRSSSRDVFNGLTDHRLLQRCLRCCRLCRSYIINISSTAAMFAFVVVINF